MTQLTPTQAEILTAASRNPDGRVSEFPANLRGGARAKVVSILVQQQRLEYRNDELIITDAGRIAIGCKPSAPLAEVEPNNEIETGVEVETAEPEIQPEPEKMANTEIEVETGTEAEVTNPEKTEPAPWAPKAGTKMALLLDKLRNPEGADVETLMAATGWQKHSVRGSLSTLGQQPGITISKTKVDGKLIYRSN